LLDILVDLVFNGEKFREVFIMKLSRNFVSASLCVLLGLGVAACNSTRTQESFGEYVDDSVVTARVKAAIVGDDYLKATEINVETFKGTVQLSGFVRSQNDISRAVDVTRRVHGVRSVVNKMSIK
jgi:osmotically-inducible protein OsmY